VIGQRGGLDRADERHGGIGLALNLKLGPEVGRTARLLIRSPKEIFP
jgi:hypothetical protein